MKNLEINKWVEDLLGMYQHSVTGNFDNRGLSSDFSRKTYIETLLDTDLLPAIIRNDFKAVFLTGNPGDGKTAFLEKLYDKLHEEMCEENWKNSSGWEVKHNGITFTSCYDASESYNGIPADERLQRLFRHLVGDFEPETNNVILVAINDGKLHSFFNNYENKKTYKWLSNTVLHKAFSPHGNDIGSVVVVNLKERTLVDLEVIPTSPENSIFDRLLSVFTAPENWEICNSCTVQYYCPIYANVESIGFGDMTGQVRKRLKLLFIISQLRKLRHNTVRDIRSALSFIITGNLKCENIHNKILMDGSSLNVYDHLYYNSIFMAEDETLKWLTELDPSKVSIPQLDRQLAMLYNQNKIQQTNGLFPQRIISTKLDANQIDMESWIMDFRRHLFFEGKEEKFEGNIKGVQNALDLLPYRFLNLFIQHLNKNGSREELKDNICGSFSQMEGIRDFTISKKYLLIRVTQNTKEGLTICKKLPSNDFDVFTPDNKHPFIESICNKLIFKHNDSGIHFILSLDLFEILMRMSDGLLPFSEEQKAVLDELADFKSRLHRYKAQDLLLIESNGQFHQITQRDGIIVREMQSI